MYPASRKQFGSMKSGAGRYMEATLRARESFGGMLNRTGEMKWTKNGLVKW